MKRTHEWHGASRRCTSPKASDIWKHTNVAGASSRSNRAHYGFQRRHRRGLTLLEVILAIAILGIAMVALGQLVRLGSRAATDARDLAEAQVLCDSKVSEIRAGLLPLESASAAAIETSPRWQYSVTVEASELPGLLLVQVTVNQDPTLVTRSTVFSLVRFMPDPEYQPELIGEEG